MVAQPIIHAIAPGKAFEDRKAIAGKRWLDGTVARKNIRKENAAIIGLSALMTTTMTEMKEVVDLAKAQGVKAKIIIGGAVVTESYAEEIGADGYSKDAREAVKLVNKLLGR